MSSYKKEKNYYDILEVSKEATIDEIRKSYKKLALKWHPDKNAENKEKAEMKFKDISEAYAVLSDPQKKKEYDNFVEYGHDAGFDFDFDFSRNFGSGFADKIFKEFFGRNFGQDNFFNNRGFGNFGFSSGFGGFDNFSGFDDGFDDNDNDDFFRNFGSSGGSTFNFSSSSTTSGYGRGTSIKKTTQIINGKKVTKTEKTTYDEHGNKQTEIIEEHDDGHGHTNMEILKKKAPKNT